MTRPVSAKARFFQQARTRCEARCFALELADGSTVYRWTTHNRQLTLQGEIFGEDYTYAPGVYAPHPGLKASSIRFESGFRGNSMQLSGATVSDAAVGITYDQIRADKIRGAILRQWIVDWRSPMAWAHYDVFEVANVTGGDEWSLELIGRPVRRMQARQGHVFGLQCRNELGVDDSRVSFCSFDLTKAATSNTGTFTAVSSSRQITGTGVGAGLAIGDVVQALNFASPDLTDAFTLVAVAADAITVDRDIPDEVGDGNEIVARVGYVDALVSSTEDRRKFTVAASTLIPDQMAANWFRHGRVEMQATVPADRNDGLREVIQESSVVSGSAPNLTLTVTLTNSLPFPITLGHVVRLIPGCDLLPGTCRTKFAQFDRFRGFSHVEGADKALKTADAG